MPRQVKPITTTVYVLRTKYIVMIKAVVTEFQLALDWERSNPDYRYYIKHVVDDKDAIKGVKELIRNAQTS